MVNIHQYVKFIIQIVVRHGSDGRELKREVSHDA